MKLFIVRLAHATGGKTRPVRYAITATNHLAAVDAILEHAHAPRSAVLTWEEATPGEVRKWRKETGIV